MRKRNLLVVVLAAVLVPVLLLLVFLKMHAIQLIAYYSDESNYVTVIGKVTHMKYGFTDSSQEDEFLCLAVSDVPAGFSDSNFKIVGENLAIVRQNGINEKIKIGDEIQFASAPEYFGDGYIAPIVSLSVNDEILLDFEDGYSNLLKWLKK